MNLLSHHALALDRQASVSFARQPANNRVCLSRVARPVNLRAGVFRIRGELLQLSIEMKQRFILDRAGLSA